MKASDFMKKTNFFVVFWLLLSLISFIVFVISFSSFWNDIAYLVFPSNEQYMNEMEIKRDMIKVVPMIILGASVFVVGIKQGLKTYHES